jgi:glycosyltransferase involved in cell wall biosynthesis
VPPEKFSIRWIFEEEDDGEAKLPQLYGLGEEIIFPVAGGKQQTTYDMAKRLSALIPNHEGVVLANFRHDLVTLHLHRRPLKTIFFICHDEGYLYLAEQFEFLIDVFIAHNYQFYEAMTTAMPLRKNDIFFIPFGVTIPPTTTHHTDDAPLRIVIAARMQVSKGVYDIPLIDDLLNERGVVVHWTIIGDGPEKLKLKKLLEPRGNFAFHAPASNDEVRRLMVQQDVFILPSRLDGLPVALLEAMSVGCVPVISAFNEGIRKVVLPEIGFVLPVGDNALFAEKIALLHGNRTALKERSRAARSAVEKHYNISSQAAKYVELFERYKELKKPMRKKFHRYGGWLDLPFWPSSFRHVLRMLKRLVINK